MARLALDQSVVGDTAANVYLVTDVERVVGTLGTPGYSLVQSEGGIATGRLYLATHAHLAPGGRGCTFYDNTVGEHLTPPEVDRMSTTMFAFGRPAE